MKDGLYFNGNICNYNFVQGDRWVGWTSYLENSERWLEWQGKGVVHNHCVWRKEAKLKIPVEYLT